MLARFVDVDFLFLNFPCAKYESIIQVFFERYAVDQDLVVKYIHHLAYLQMIKQKRERGRKEKSERERILRYEDME